MRRRARPVEEVLPPHLRSFDVEAWCRGWLPHPSATPEQAAAARWAAAHRRWRNARRDYLDEHDPARALGQWIEDVQAGRRHVAEQLHPRSASPHPTPNDGGTDEHH